MMIQKNNSTSKTKSVYSAVLKIKRLSTN